jgi:hypothetical protein
MTWSQILTHVRHAEQCDKNEARGQIGNAIQDGALFVRWADERSMWGVSSPSPIHQTPQDMPPRDADYWMKCEIAPNDPDSVREPTPYDSRLVSDRRAKQLDKRRRFRAPRFSQYQVSQLWEDSRGSATTATETKAKTFPSNCLRGNPKMKRDDDWTACRKEFPTLSERGFRERVWPDARDKAGLERIGRPGRKPTLKKQTS